MTDEEIRNKINTIVGLEGMTVNERLYATGLMDVFDKSKVCNKALARRILLCLNVDVASVNEILK